MKSRLSVEDRKVLDKLAKEFKIEREEAKQVWSEIPANYCFGKKQLERAVVLSRQSVEARVVEASKLSLVEFLHFVGCLSRDRAKAGDEKNG